MKDRCTYFKTKLTQRDTTKLDPRWDCPERRGWGQVCAAGRSILDGFGAAGERGGVGGETCIFVSTSEKKGILVAYESTVYLKFHIIFHLC